MRIIPLTCSNPVASFHLKVTDPVRQPLSPKEIFQLPLPFNTQFFRFAVLPDPSVTDNSDFIHHAKHMIDQSHHVGFGFLFIHLEVKLFKCLINLRGNIGKSSIWLGLLLIVVFAVVVVFAPSFH